MYDATPLPLLAAGFAALDAADVPWVLLRGRDELAAPPGDVDLLVHPRTAARAQAALVDAGFAPRRAWARGTQRSLLGYDERAGVWIELHVVSEVAAGPWYEFELPVSAPLVAAAEVRDGVPVLRGPDEFWVTLLHALLDKGSIPATRGQRLLALSTGAGSSPVADALDRVVPGRAAELLDLVSQQRWHELAGAGPRLTTAWAHADPAVRRRRWRHRLSMRARKLVEPVTRRTLTVAVMAPDGAGKTTLVESLRDRLYFPVRVAYLGLEGGRFAARATSLPGVGLLHRLAVMWWAYAAARHHVARRRFVLFDRHPYDARLDDGRSRPPLARLRRRLLGGALPLPDVVLVLDAPPEVLHARKPEHPLDEAATRRRAYLALARDVGATVLDAAQPPEEVARAAVRAIWRAYRDRLVP
ncbi:MAG TPA: hypothetical protein VGA69_01415 [Nitriliruptorales bacterium]